MPLFRSIKVRAKKPQCPACGDDKHKVGTIEETDYVAFCGGLTPDWEAIGTEPGDRSERISATVRCSSAVALSS